MSATFVYRFTWDSAKASANRGKHAVTFEQAATVLRDPLALTRYDEDHSQHEDRWVTMGMAEGGRLIVVVHTMEHVNDKEAVVHLISAREATHRERLQYEGGAQSVQEQTPDQNWNGDAMKPEYDFSKATRGKFHRPGADLQLPIYLEPRVQEALALRAREQGVDVASMANEILRAAIGQSGRAK
jgi:uncharacterized DUF497 family protein